MLVARLATAGRSWLPTSMITGMPASAIFLMRRGELALVRGVRVARLVRVAGEDEDVHALLDRVVADVAQPAQEVHDARVDPGRGVDPPVVFHADVNVGGVEEFDGLHVVALLSEDRRDADDADYADNADMILA